MRLQDARCQRLWNCSDLRTLAVVAERWPAFCPEWDAILAAHAPVATRAALLAHPPTPPDQYLGDDGIRREWAAYTMGLRWRIAKWLALGFIQPGRCLDLGAHTGANAVDMANQWPLAQVYAREPQPAIAALIPETVRLFAQHPERIVVECGDALDPPLPSDLHFVWAGEVLEHQWEWRPFCDAMHTACAPGAFVAYSTPLGPWEPRDRAYGMHVAHWEPEDVLAVFGHLPGFGLYLDRLPQQLGNCIFWYLWPGGPVALPAYPIEQKLRRWGFA